MKKFYRISLLLIIFIFLSTYSPNKFDLTVEKKSDFFKIQKIVILNNLIVKKSNINKKLQTKQFLKNYSNFCPKKRKGKPEDVAGSAIFLASKASSYITGSTFMIDGGWSAI